MSHRRFHRFAFVGAAALVAVTAGCGGSDDGAEPDPTSAPAETAAAEDATTEDASTDDAADTGANAGTGVADAVGAGDALDSASIDTMAMAIGAAMGGEAEVVNDTTIRVVLDGDVEANGPMACIIADAVLTQGQTLIVAYPNGEQTCE